MTGSFMLGAFILGFWCIWSANRDVNSPIEALIFTILAIAIRALMTWSGFPDFTNLFLATWGILFIYTIVVLELVHRFSRTMSGNMVISLVGALGWFVLVKWAFGSDGAKIIAGWIS